MKSNLMRCLFLVFSFVALFVFAFCFDKKDFNTSKAEKEKAKFQTEAQIEKEKNVYLGEFVLTAYCPCDICCGEYGKNRPVDENGKEIVYGAIGARLKQGVSIAVDPSVIPHGTKVEIDGKIYIAQDCGGAIRGKRIDIYYDSHQDALNFGVQTKSVYIIEG